MRPVRQMKPEAGSEKRVEKLRRTVWRILGSVERKEDVMYGGVEERGRYRTSRRAVILVLWILAVFFRSHACVPGLGDGARSSASRSTYRRHPYVLHVGVIG